MRFRKSNKHYGSINIYPTSTPIITVRPSNPELTLALIQFAFLDTSVTSLQTDKEVLTRDQYETSWMSDSPVAHISCGLLLQDGKILIGQRSLSNKLYGGAWEFPGGKLEQDETPAQALVRELQEELGITVAIDDLKPIKTYSYVYPKRKVMLHIFECDKWRGEIKDIVHDNLQWVDLEELKQVQLLPADLPLLMK